MVVLELRPPHGGFQEGLECASKIDKAVAHEEEHTQKRSQRVHVANEYGHLIGKRTSEMGKRAKILRKED